MRTNLESKRGITRGFECLNNLAPVVRSCSKLKSTSLPPSQVEKVCYGLTTMNERGNLRKIDVGSD